MRFHYLLRNFITLISPCTEKECKGQKRKQNITDIRAIQELRRNGKARKSQHHQVFDLTRMTNVLQGQCYPAVQSIKRHSKEYRFARLVSLK